MDGWVKQKLHGQGKASKVAIALHFTCVSIVGASYPSPDTGYDCMQRISQEYCVRAIGASANGSLAPGGHNFFLSWYVCQADMVLRRCTRAWRERQQRE